MALPKKMNPVEVWIQKQGQPNVDDPDRRISDDTITMGRGKNVTPPDGPPEDPEEDPPPVEFGYDEDFREPSGVRDLSDPIKLHAQVATRRFNELVETITGDQERQQGHLTFRKKDLDKVGIEFTNGDRIIKMGDFEVDLMVEQSRPRAPLRGRFRLVQVDYIRNQSKRSSQQ